MSDDGGDDWEQLGLFATPTPPRRNDPETSDAAAASVNRFHARALHLIQLRMLRRLYDRPEMRTHEGLWIAYNEWRREDKELPKVSISGFRTRLSELKNASYVRDSGQRAPMSTGRMAVVWDLTMEGIDALRTIDRQRGRTM